MSIARRPSFRIDPRRHFQQRPIVAREQLCITAQARVLDHRTDRRAVRVPFAFRRAHIAIFLQSARKAFDDLARGGVIAQFVERVQQVRRVAKPELAVRERSRVDRVAVEQQEQERLVRVKRGLQFFVGETNLHPARQMRAPSGDRLRARLIERAGRLEIEDWRLVVFVELLAFQWHARGQRCALPGIKFDAVRGNRRGESCGTVRVHLTVELR